MVQTVMTLLDDTPNLDVKLTVIETLRTVTEGKVLITLDVKQLSVNSNRFSSKSSAPELRVSFQTSRKNKAILPRQQTFFVSYKWRHSAR